MNGYRKLRAYSHSINRWNQAYKGKAIYEAAKAMAEGVKVGETREYSSL